MSHAYSHWDMLLFLQINLGWSVTCMKVSVWMPALRPSTTPRRAAVSRARTTASSARVLPTASNVILPTTSLMELVPNWSVEKVSRVIVSFMGWFSYLLCYIASKMILKSFVSHLFFWLFLMMCLLATLCFSFFCFLSGEVEDPDYDDCMACEEGCRQCVLCKSQLSRHIKVFSKLPLPTADQAFQTVCCQLYSRFFAGILV